MKTSRKEQPKQRIGNTEGKEKSSFEIRWFYAVGLFIVFTAVFFWQQIVGNAFFWEDFVEYVYPVQSFAASEFSKGIIPFWNPYSFVGMPFLADLQVGFFYPLNRILSLFVNSDGNLPASILQLVTILHFLIAQLSMYFLARHLKVSSAGSIISAVSYSFSFLLVLHVIHPMILSHLAWFPLIFMFLHKGLTEQDLRSSIYSGLLFGMVMLSGHPQLTLFIALFLGLFVVWFVVADIIKSKDGSFANKSILKYILACTIPFLIAFGIFQIQFLPSNELAKLSKRSEMTYEKASEGSLRISQLFTSIAPKLYGSSDSESKAKVPFYLMKNKIDGEQTQAPYFYYWETGFYFGITALILGLFGFIALYKERFAAFLLAVSIFGFLFALGSNGFIYSLFHNLPFFEQLRNPARMLFVLSFAFTLLAGFGFDKLVSSKDKSIQWKLIISAAIPVFFAVLIATGFLPSILGANEKFVSTIQGYGTTALIISIIVFLFAFLSHKKFLSASIAGIMFAIIAFFDLYIAGSDFNISKNSIEKQYELPKQTLEAFRPSYPDDLFRVNMRMYNPSYTAFKRNQGMISGIQLLEGYNPLLLERVVPPLESKDEIHKLFNVKYEIEIDHSRGVPYFNEKQDRLPRAWLASEYFAVTEDATETIMRNNPFDYENAVMLEKKPTIELPFYVLNNDTMTVAKSADGNVKFVEYSSNKMKIEVESKENAILVLSEIYYPAWKAYVDGKETEIYRANYCFRAVPIEAGKHTVEFRYESSSFKTGAWLTLLTLILSVIGIIVLRRLERK